jgi:hypothetical protein
MSADSHDPTYDNLLSNLAHVQQWVSDTKLLVASLRTHDDFMKKVVECMSMALYLFRVGLFLVPDEARSRRGFSKRQAIALGHVVRINPGFPF